MQQSLSVPIGTIIDEKLQVIGFLASGGMGSVYKARQIGLDRIVALKFLLGQNPEPEYFLRFEREAKTLCQLNHKNIVAFYGYGVWRDTPYMFLELVDGTNLFETKEHGPTLSCADAVKIIKNVCQALGYAHSRGVVHRDLKPENIIVADNRDIKLIDFGLAKSIESTKQTLTEAGTAIGTALYMSPEQCRAQECTAASDLYALGCILFYLLTGTPPFLDQSAIGIMQAHAYEQPPTLAMRNAALSEQNALQEIMDRCMAKEPAERYTSADELLADLNKLDLTGLQLITATKSKSPAANKQEQDPPQSSNKPRLPKVHIMAAVIAASVGLSVVAYYVYHIQSNANSKQRISPKLSDHEGLEQAQLAAKWKTNALSFAERGDIAETVRCLREYRRLAPRDVESESYALSLLANTLIKQRRYKDAVTVFDNRSVLNRTYRPDSLNCIEAILSAENARWQFLNEESEDAYVKARTALENSVDVNAYMRAVNYSMLGVHEQRRERPEQAERDFEQSTKWWERAGERWEGKRLLDLYRLGRAQIINGKKAKGMKNLNETLDKLSIQVQNGPDSRESFESAVGSAEVLASEFLRQQRYAEAKAVLNREALLLPKGTSTSFHKRAFGRYWMNLGEVQYRLGDKASAKGNIEKSIAALKELQTSCENDGLPRARQRVIERQILNNYEFLAICEMEIGERETALQTQETLCQLLDKHFGQPDPRFVREQKHKLLEWQSMHN